jgi:hypothetical protein
MHHLSALTLKKEWLSLQRVLLSRREANPAGTVWATDTSHLTLTIDGGFFKYLQHFCDVASHAHVVYPMKNLSALAFVEAVTYVCDLVKQRFGNVVKQFQGDCFSSIMNGGPMMDARRSLEFSISLFSPFRHWRSIIENYIRHTRDQSLRRMQNLRGIMIRGARGTQAVAPRSLRGRSIQD